MAAGCGDYQITDISMLPDPCPLPDSLKKRSLNERERAIYAPFSGVGGIVYDKDAVYIDMGPNNPHKPQSSQVRLTLLLCTWYVSFYGINNNVL